MFKNHDLHTNFCLRGKYLFWDKSIHFIFKDLKNAKSKVRPYCLISSQKRKQPGVLMREKVEFLHPFFAQSGSILI